MAAGWWSLLAARGLLPAGFAIATGVLVAAVERRSGLAAPLIAVAVVFVLMQVLGPLHTALSANLGDRTAAWLYDELTGACVAVPGIGHLEDPELAADLQVARDFDRGMTGPPLSISMDFIAGGLVDMVAGLAQACVLFGFAWWAPPALAGGWLATHWLLRESAVWRDRNTAGGAAGAAGRRLRLPAGGGPAGGQGTADLRAARLGARAVPGQQAAAAPAAVRGDADARALGAAEPRARPGRQRAGVLDARGGRARWPDLASAPSSPTRRRPRARR